MPMANVQVIMSVSKIFSLLCPFCKFHICLCCPDCRCHNRDLSAQPVLVLVYEVLPSVVFHSLCRCSCLHEVAVCHAQCVGCVHESGGILSCGCAAVVSAYLPPVLSKPVPCPVIAIFIFIGAYSCMGTLWCTAAAIATPCERPSLSIDCTFLPKNGASMAISVGQILVDDFVTCSNILPRRRHGSPSLRMSITPIAISFRLVADGSYQSVAHDIGAGVDA